MNTVENARRICGSVTQIQSKSDEFCLVKCSHFNTKFSAIVDTGSKENILSEELAKRLKLKITPFDKNGPHKNNLINATGGEMKEIGNAEMSFKLGGLIFTQNFTIIKDLSSPCLLGRTFCAYSKAHIKFSDFTLTLCDDTTSVNHLTNFREAVNLIAPVKSVTLQPMTEYLLPVLLHNP